MVARDGIEPPTPAFSGPRSTTELSGLGKPKGAAFAQVVSESAISGEKPGQVSNCAQATSPSITIRLPSANPLAYTVSSRHPLNVGFPTMCLSRAYVRFATFALLFCLLPFAPAQTPGGASRTSQAFERARHQGSGGHGATVVAGYDKLQVRARYAYSRPER